MNHHTTNIISFILLVLVMCGPLLLLFLAMVVFKKDGPLRRNPMFSLVGLASGWAIFWIVFAWVSGYINMLAI